MPVVRVNQLQLFSIIFFILNINIWFVKPHGYMIEPAQRGSMWRAGFNTAINYNDMSKTFFSFFIEK